MAKRKRLTLTESHLEELFLKYVEVLKYKPDYWERVGYKHRLDTWKRLRLGLLAEQSLLEKDPIGFLKSALNYDSYELFKYLLPRDMEPETRFGPKQVETWKSGYKIYGLHRKEGLNFRQIAKLLGKSRSTVHRLYKKVHKHIELTEHDRDTIRRQEEKIHPPTVLCLGKEGRQTDRCP